HRDVEQQVGTSTDTDEVGDPGPCLREEDRGRGRNDEEEKADPPKGLVPCSATAEHEERRHRDHNDGENLEYDGHGHHLKNSSTRMLMEFQRDCPLALE